MAELSSTHPSLVVAGTPTRDEFEVTALALTNHGASTDVCWVSAVPLSRRADLAEHANTLLATRSAPVLPAHWEGPLTRPALRGFHVGTGVSGSRGSNWSPRFTTVSLSQGTDGAASLRSVDRNAGLVVDSTFEGNRGGTVRVRHVLRNDGRLPFCVESLDVVLPVPPHAVELLDFTGGRGDERSPQRTSLDRDGSIVREGSWGKPGPDAPFAFIAGSKGFSFGQGDVWAIHVAWSGNSVYRLERASDGRASLRGGEALLPGEVILRPGGSYTTPWVFVAASSRGLDGCAQQFHSFLRALPSHPIGDRPVNFNVWEAIGFDLDVDVLLQLADLAADVGAERYVLDDGWFGDRRSDRAGLGDWHVSTEAFPDGLDPLIDRVHKSGMRFGLWIEPEMINEESSLYRAHPDWVLSTGGRLPVRERNQLVLDLTQPEAFAHVLERLDVMLSSHAIDYVKWDHNRSLVDGGSPSRGGAPAVHEQTEAFYRLLDELRLRHPDVEWETCAGGGGRIDLGVLSRVQRLWASDNTDALSRQHIQRWTGQLVPPEYVGAHVSQPFAQSTGRHMSMRMRGATALFGHFGIEWNLLATTATERDELRAWVDLYKRHRLLIHTGTQVRLDMSDPSLFGHGVVAADRTSALFCVTWLPSDTASAFSAPTTMRLRELDHDRTYRIAAVDADASAAHTARTADEPIESGPTQVLRPPAVDVVASGAALTLFGVPIPQLAPLSPLLLHVTSAS